MTRHLPLLAALVVCTTASAIDPGSLPSAGPIVHGGGDADFLAALPSLNALYSNVAPSASPGPAFFDFGGLILPSGWNVRVYFVSKDASFTDALGVTPVSGDATIGQTVFANTSSLSQGDYVQFTGPQFLSFFAMTGDGPSGGDTWWGDPALNADSTTDRPISHLDAAIDALASTPSSLWLGMALDDQFGGGDRDWNDVRFAIHAFQVTAPEPATWALLVGFAAVAVWMWRRRAALV